ncbi:MAG: cupin domain-containing protein [Devosia sp.]|jgi:quercetin dioxygenase-like cupin family protein|uniref:cupin domain-containing protein n=1 Tax=unclassified Devosia TaxID=196773 RepID=UPI000928C548|nr:MULTISPECIES: cupin domain-containing protein [unclassified Devosia]MBL8597615.1 cupin domain-containing protein [Devosia sp.]MBN9346297.1 cupin domain-containing protein [Devosia sp.]OJX47636.1 MAG: cupin [Devosia sp. 66-22]
MSDPKVFAQPGDGRTTQLDGSSRRVVLDLPELMLVEFVFEKGGVGALHSHPHVQSSYVAEGVFDVTIDGVTQRIAAGGAYIVPSGLVHGVVALEAGKLIDSFTPRRDDFL